MIGIIDDLLQRYENSKAFLSFLKRFLDFCLLLIFTSIKSLNIVAGEWKTCL